MAIPGVSDEGSDCVDDLMDKIGLRESSFFELELSRQHQFSLRAKKEIRHQVSALVTNLNALNEKKFSAKLADIEKFREERWEMERKMDREM